MKQLKGEETSSLSLNSQQTQHFLLEERLMKSVNLKHSRSSLMASTSSSSPPRTWKYRVFASFHGPDVRKSFLSHLRKQFSCNGITMFDDQGIERSQIIAPALTLAIRESRISIVVLTKNYASSGWCLNELLEILECKRVMKQIVMTIFYGVDPRDVRNQTGEFGRAFDETCARKAEEKRQLWSQALTHVGNIAGEHFENWDNESNMIEKISIDASNKLNNTISKDFKDMVGIEAHLQRMQSLLHLDYEDGAMIVGICGPAGIGKTTIARALHSRLSSSFQLTCFMDNLRGSSKSGLDEYGLKLCLQEKLLSKILNQNGMMIYHLGAIPERLCDQKVLIILDDVDDLQQLEALAHETNWFGPGSRIIVTTEDQELLEQHDINNIYHVDFPTKEEAHNIFCRYAFNQRYAPYGFEKLVKRVTKLCSKLPLGLRVMGSSLRGKKEDDWEGILHRLETSLDRKMEGVLRVGYDNLHKDDQLLFLHIAFFFNYEYDDHIMAMLADSSFDVVLGLKNLAYNSLIHISTNGKVVMHKLLQQVGRQAVERQEPWKRQILIDTDEIRDVLENDSGNRTVTGISFDVSTILDGVYISAGAFKNLRNLRFLCIYETRRGTNVRVHIPEDIDFPPRLRLLHWQVYPRKCLPPTFRPEYLVELSLQRNDILEKLWEGTQPLTNLKKMDLSLSLNLKELPDLSNATNLESLDLGGCQSLVEIPLSIGNLHKLKSLKMDLCLKLQVFPTQFNLASLEYFEMVGCTELRKFPVISTNITSLVLGATGLAEFPESVRLCSRLEALGIYGKFMPFLKEVFRETSVSCIERIPDWIKDLHGLKELCIVGCPKLESLPELPSSLRRLEVHDCESLETVISFPIDFAIEFLYFPNCFKLSQEAQRVITQQPGLVHACLPGRNIRAEFDYRARGNSSLTIRSNFVDKFRICVVLSPEKQMLEAPFKLLCRISLNGCLIEESIYEELPYLKVEHLLISPYELLEKEGWLEQNNELLFEFSTTSQSCVIVECGVLVLSDKSEGSISSYGNNESCYSEEDERNYESCFSEQVSEEDDDECLSDGSYESCSGSF